ncbi:MAG: hypothetical protein ABEJ22_04780 [Haloferacaceae archaeon]
MSHVETFIVATKSVTLVLGGLISMLAYRAYSRTEAPSLRSLSVGFAVVTTGAILGGVVDLFTPIELVYGVVAQSALTAVGFGIITYSLYSD